MSASTRKVTVNLPEEALQRAMAITGKGITQTLIDGLYEIERRHKRSALRQLRGQVDFELDLHETRQ